MKFLHAADLHLDSPLRGLSRYEGAPVARIRGASRRALSNLVDLCLAEQVQLLLLAGDLFDGDWRDYSTGLFFAAQLSRLREAQVRVVMIRGNHDAESQISRSLRLPPHVTELSTAHPETCLLGDLGVAVHGQGFATRIVSEDLAAGYPQPVADCFNIGLLHTAVGGRPGHEPYAPCTVDGLRSKGYGYWALGHVHTREVLSVDPPILFPGNLQGRHIREVGPKGATLVEVVDGRVARIEHRTLDVVRFALTELSLAGLSHRDDALEIARERLGREVAAADGRLLCTRIRLVGRCEVHAQLHREHDRLVADLRSLANDFAGDLWVEKIQLATEPPTSAAELQLREDALGQVLQAIASTQADPSELVSLADTLTELKQKLPVELREGADGVRPDDPDYIREVLDEVREMLLVRLQAVDSA